MWRRTDDLPVATVDAEVMRNDDDHDRDLAGDARDRESFAIRKEERAAAAKLKSLERALVGYSGDIDRAKRTIEHDLREEGVGHEPADPPAWLKRPPEDRDGD